jgi:HAMP domain-containing protein
MMPQAELPLRDIHLPDPISWWPPAPGWWLLAALFLTVIGLLYWAIQVWRRGRLRRDAHSALARIRTSYEQHGSAHRLAADLSILLRRIAISGYPRTEVAALTNQQWLAFLDQVFEKRKPGAQANFSHGVGRVLIEAPYRPSMEVDAQGLIELCEQWIDAVPAMDRQGVRR